MLLIGEYSAEFTECKVSDEISLTNDGVFG